MEKIVWNAKFCTGIEKIDSQHKRIISQINFLIDNLNSEDKAYLNGEIIRNLDKYSKEHFFTEEEFLRKINYPNLEDHLKLHKAFKMNTVKSAISVLKGNEHVPEETIKFLKKWWSNHILKADMEYKNFIPKS
jgi:hemerythrin-like metal-binding protein